MGKYPVRFQNVCPLISPPFIYLYFCLKYMFYSGLLSFYLMSHPGHRITFSCVSSGSSWLCWFLRLSSYLVTFGSFEDYWPGICRMLLSWDLFDVFLIIGLGLGGRLEVKCHSYHIISKVYTINMTHHFWCSPWSRGWGSVCQFSPLWSYSFFILSIMCSLVKEVTT